MWLVFFTNIQLSLIQISLYSIALILLVGNKDISSLSLEQNLQCTYSINFVQKNNSDVTMLLQLFIIYLNFIAVLMLSQYKILLSELQLVGHLLSDVKIG